MDFIDHDFHHLLADKPLLGVLGVAGGFDLSGGSAGEADTEESEEVAVSSLGLDEGLNEGVPLLDEGAKLVLGNIKTVEVSVAVVALHFFDLNLNLSPGLGAAGSVQISQRYFEHSALQGISGVLYFNIIILNC